VAALTAEHRHSLADWRGYSPKFVDWLHAQGIVGLFDGKHIAFPVHIGNVVPGCHYRLQQDGYWRYHPTGTHTAPLIIGDIAHAHTVYTFESQWDLLAVLDAFHWHIQSLDGTAAIATRGASNGRLLAGLCAAGAVVYAFSQNDDAGQKWLASVAAHCNCKTFHVVTPPAHKDPNDWSRAGATAPDLHKAIADAKPVAPPTLQEPRATPPVDGLAPITLPADNTVEDARVPFPIECLPPDMALMVRAVAEALGVPDALPAGMVMALTSGCIGKGLVLDWRPGKAPTPANLYVMLSAQSGTGKTECYKMIAAPFLAFERDMQEHWRKEVQPQLQADLRYAEGQLKKLDRKLAKDSTTQDEAEHCRSQMQFHLAKTEELKAKLHEPQLSIQDATVEKVATVMHQNDETILSVSSDARKLVDNLLGRYSANKNLADDGIYLSAFSGDDVKVDRQGREGVRLANPSLALLWALQPDALDMLLDQDSLQQGGFLARCLLAHTYAEPQYICAEARGLSDAMRIRWANFIYNLLTTYRQPGTLPATQDEEL
jgi:hypothetical protein